MAWRNGESWAVRDGNWKLVRYAGEPPFLFDLAADPDESDNRAPEGARRVAELELFYRAWEKDMVEPLWTTRKPLYTMLPEILARKPMRLLQDPEPGSISIDF